MKRFVKRLLRFIYIDILLIYVKYASLYQMRYKLLIKEDRLTNNEKDEIRKYWKKFDVKVNLEWHKWYYSRNGIKDVRYIPEDIFYTKIESYYNNTELYKAYSDKAMYNIWFKDAKLPNTIGKNVNGIFYDDDFTILSREQLVEKCLLQKQIIIKPSLESGAGKGIIVLENTELMVKHVNEALDMMGKNFVIQVFLEQHENLKSLNPTSVNTIRMLTFLHENEVVVLSAHIRIGTNNSTNDHNGIICGIDDNGVLKDVAYIYKKGLLVTTHPQGYNFKNVIVPSFNKIKEIAIKEHQKFGHFKVISWDFAVDKNENPILIEFNLKWQGLNHHQLTAGPLFGNKTEQVLSEIFNERKIN